MALVIPSQDPGLHLPTGKDPLIEAENHNQIITGLVPVIDGHQAQEQDPLQEDMVHLVEGHQGMDPIGVMAHQDITHQDISPPDITPLKDAHLLPDMPPLAIILP